MSDVAPVLVLAVGNPSRGDDAIGPVLASRIEAAGWPGVEVITEFQLQVENALDLVGRERTLFIDAGTGTPGPIDFRKVTPLVPGTDSGNLSYTSHALSPEAVLETYARVQAGPPPESWILCVRGERFDLGEGLSPDAARNVDAAWDAARDWLASK